MEHPPKILILKTGTTNPPVVEMFGDYDDWFQRCLASYSLQWYVVNVYLDEPIPTLDGFSGVMITGSPSSVWEREPWMLQTIEWFTERIEQQDIPILAVCFGHQLLGAALGGVVEPNVHGAENGTIVVNLTEEGQQDPLFSDLSSVINVQSVHKDIVVDIPNRMDTICLGNTDNTAIQALAVGQNIRSVQFHPEIVAPVLAKLFEVRKQDAEVFVSSDGVSILESWVKHWLG
jgi:GMP synthase (glutamine-hydrolysing)